MAYRVCVVCTGNICRSPMGDVILRDLLDRAGLGGKVEVDSAGTGDWHVGKAPDARTRAAALRRGYDLSSLRARQVSLADFSRYDLILAMDNANLRDLKHLRGSGGKAELDLFLRRYELEIDEVPDPYYGGEDGFERVLDLVERACDGLLTEVKGRL